MVKNLRYLHFSHINQSFPCKSASQNHVKEVVFLLLKTEKKPMHFAVNSSPPKNQLCLLMNLLTSKNLHGILTETNSTANLSHINTPLKKNNNTQIQISTSQHHQISSEHRHHPYNVIPLPSTLASENSRRVTPSWDM